jgi:predicted amidohydrolase
MRVALAQLDARLGDVEANAARVRETMAAAAAQDVDLVVFPELYLSGYALAGDEDDTALDRHDVARLAPDRPAAVVGFREAAHNSAAYVQEGAVVHVQHKVCLVDYPPFDEHEKFAPGDELRAFDTDLGRQAILICNDAWHPAVPFLAREDGAEVLLMPSCSSGAVREAEAYWRGLTRFYARMLESYVVFVNRVGTEGAFAFWGGSHVVDPRGDVVVEAPRLDEALVVAEIDVERVAERRRELPLLRESRLDLLSDELTRLRNERRISLQFANSGGMTDARALDSRPDVVVRSTQGG